MSPAAYMSRETLARALDLKPSAIDQYVRRGLLPAPKRIGEAVRWRWADVDEWLRAGEKTDASAFEGDPYLEGLQRAKTPTKD